MSRTQFSSGEGALDSDPSSLSHLASTMKVAGANLLGLGGGGIGLKILYIYTT